MRLVSHKDMGCWKCVKVYSNRCGGLHLRGGGGWREGVLAPLGERKVHCHRHIGGALPPGFPKLLFCIPQHRILNAALKGVKE